MLQQLKSSRMTPNHKTSFSHFNFLGFKTYISLLQTARDISAHIDWHQTFLHSEVNRQNTIAKICRAHGTQTPE